MPLNWRVEKEDVVHLHSGILIRQQNNNNNSNNNQYNNNDDISKIAGKWMDMEKKHIEWDNPLCVLFNGISHQMCDIYFWEV